MNGAGITGLEIGGSGGTSYTKGYFYTTGFDYIGASLCDYKERGIYVTTPLESTSRITELYLSANYDKSEDGLGNVKDSIEFSVFKYDYDSSNGLISYNRYPIPSNTSDTLHEELIINTATGILRFYPNTSSLVVYRDNSPLNIGTDYQVSNNGVDFYNSLSGLGAPDGPPWKFYIKLISPLATSVYTVSYTVASSVNSENNYLDQYRLVHIDSNRVINFEYSPGDLTAYSKVYLVAVMRSFDYSNRETPILEDYSLYAAEK